MGSPGTGEKRGFEATWIVFINPERSSRVKAKPRRTGIGRSRKILRSDIDIMKRYAKPQDVPHLHGRFRAVPPGLVLDGVHSPLAVFPQGRSDDDRDGRHSAVRRLPAAGARGHREAAPARGATEGVPQGVTQGAAQEPGAGRDDGTRAGPSRESGPPSREVVRGSAREGGNGREGAGRTGGPPGESGWVGVRPGAGAPAAGGKGKAPFPRIAAVAARPHPLSGEAGAVARRTVGGARKG